MAEPQEAAALKPNERVLSLVLKAIIMFLITILFFIFIGFAAILLFSLCLAFRRRSNPHHPVSSSGLAPHLLNRVPQFRYDTTATQHNDCVVCLDTFKQGQWCRNLQACHHVFHRRCIDVWLLKKNACPVCRRPVRSAGSSEQDSTLWRWDVGTNNANHLTLW